MPTAKPTNEIIRIAEDTVNLPSTGKVNKQVPSYELRTTGYDKNKRIFAEELNYTLDNIGQWCQWFENRVDELQAQIEKERVSVGELIEITGDDTNPSVLKGYGTWEYFGEGLTTVGVGTHIDDRLEELTFTDGQTLGEYKHVQSREEIGEHNHGASSGNDTHSHSSTRVTDFKGSFGGVSSDLPYTKYVPESGESDLGLTGGQDGVGIGIKITNGTTTTGNDTHNHSVTVDDSPEADPMNNIQPSVAVYRWKRLS